MNRFKQVGSAHAVIIVVLVLALLGALGFVFYQNFIAKKPTETAVQEQGADKATAQPTVRLKFQESTYLVNYPLEWTLDGVVNTEQGSSLIATNKDATVSVYVTIVGTDLKYDCQVGDSTRKVRYYEVSKKSVELNGSKAYIVEAITDAEGGGYDYKIGLTQDGGDTHAAIGDPYCTVFNVGLASRFQKDGQTGNTTQPSITAGILFPKIGTDTNMHVKDMQSVKDGIASDDYGAATKILESIRKE